MNKNLNLMLLAGILVFSGTVYADEAPSEDQLEKGLSAVTVEAPDAGELEGAEEVPLELDPVNVTGLGLNYNQEVALRIIRQAYNAPRSERREDIDNWICWLDESTGSHFKHLNCARNGDLWALRPTSVGGTIYTQSRVAGYGRIFRSTRPANRWKLERAMEALRGSSDFDREFLGRVMAGDQPDRDIPDDEEINQFAHAWLQVGKLNKADSSEEEQVAAIEAEGLSLKRYNRIAELTESYQSVENQVDERIKALR